LSKILLMKRLSIACLLMASTSLWGQTCTTAVCNAAGVSQAQVLAALPSSGNTNATVVVNIPSGSATWTSALNYSIPSAVTNLTIQGNTTVNCTGTAGTSSYLCTATDNTIITDGFTPNGQNHLIQLTTGSTSTNFRITGITFKPIANAAKNDGLLVIGGNSHNVRIDHNHFDENSQNDSMTEMVGDTLGVADHNLFSLGGNSNVGNGFRDFASSDGTGDAAWNSATNWGTSSFWYLESNYIQGGSPTDCYNGAKLVVRYNTLDSIYVMALHGTKNDAGRGRSCRATEIYHNYAKGGTNSDAVVGQNGGTSLIWGNNIASGFNRLNAPGAPRNFTGGDSGTSPWGGMCGTTVRSAAGQGGTDPYDGNNSTSTGYPCLDGVGRGQGNLLSGNPATPSAWPAQKLEPEYMFMNTLAAANLGGINDVSSAVNRDVYADCISGKDFSGVTCSSFNGSHGTGFGLAVNRPTNCTAGPGGTYGASPTGSYGVGYWSTDTNTFSVCTATNVWTNIYSPYVYPNPLTGGGGTTYSLTVTATNGNVTGSNCASNGTIPAGTTIGTCTATANSGYTFTGWSGTGSASGVSGVSPVSFALNADSTLTATFTVNSYPLTANTAGTGTGTNVCTPSGSINFGTSVSCTASATSGAFTGWSGGVCSGTTNPCVFSMPAAAVTTTANFAAQAAAPTASPVAGTYGSTQNVALSTATSGATICYRTDGTNPSSSSPGVCAAGSTQYASPVTVASSLTIKALATKAGYSDSSVSSAAYVINGAVSYPSFSPGTGGYGSAQTVTISVSSPAAATICFTTDGSTPTTDGAGTCTHGTTYSTPITVSTSQTVNAIGSKSGYTDSGITSATYTINGALPTPTFSPAAGGYATAQTVTISTVGTDPSIIAQMTETSNALDLAGHSVHRNIYTNCAESCSGGVPQPPNSGIVSHGTLWCDPSEVVSCGSFGSSSVSSTISGTGTGLLENGMGAGGVDSAPTITATYAGTTGTGCGVGTSFTSNLFSGLTLPGETSSSRGVFGLTTAASGFDTSMLAVSKYNTNGDTGNHLERVDCASPNTVTASGQHYEWDSNYNDSTGSYEGFGMDYNFTTSKLRACFQSCAGWTDMELVPVGGGSTITTYSWPAGDYLFSERHDYWDPGCSYSSSSNCAHYGQICLQLWNAGSPVNSLTCYNIQSASTHLPISAKPVNKTTWTHPQYGVQHQWDVNSGSQTLTANVAFDHLVAFAMVDATICYTTDGSDPTADGAGTCTHGTTYTSALTVSSTTTVKAIASAPGYTDSTVGSATYTINGAAATPSYSPVAGTYTSTQSVTISSATGGATIYYTTDGSTPTTSSTVYSAPVSIAVTTTLKALATASGYTNSAVQSGTFTINSSAPAGCTIQGTVVLSGTVGVQ
jgi:uncharacterized repeat protein (TIGR02543 family)